MIRRQTIIIFSIPATFAPDRTETVNGRLVGFGAGGKMSIDGLEIASISRRGHVDPAKMRDLAITKGATGKDELTVNQYSIEHCRNYQVARFLVKAAGLANPLKVNF